MNTYYKGLKTFFQYFFCSLFALFFSFNSVNAQNKFIKISGKLIDANRRAIKYSTVQLYVKNTAIARIVNSDSLGNFVYSNVPVGGIKFAFRALNFQDSSINLNIVKDTTIIVQLKSKLNELKQVTITARKPLVEHRAGKIIFNVEMSPIASSGSLGDAIKLAPGVNLDNLGDFSLNNKSVSLYINNRKIRLSGTDLLNYMNSIPASSIANIELLSRPGAEYESSGASVININTKKEPFLGIWGTLSNLVKQTTYLKDYPSISLFYNTKKLSLSLLASSSFEKNLRIRDNTVTFNPYDSNLFSNWTTLNRTVYHVNSYLLKFDGTYQITPSSSLNGLIETNRTKTTSTAAGSTKIIDFSNRIDSTQALLNDRTYYVNQTEANIGYKSILKKNSSKTLSLIYDLILYDNKNLLLLNSSTYDPNSTFLSELDYDTQSKQMSSIQSFQSDLSGFRFLLFDTKFGYKLTDFDNTNNLNYNFTGTNTNLILFNNFKYKELNNAVYSSLNRKFKSSQLNIGLRGELTNIRGYTNDDEVVNQNYFKLFPSVAWNFDLSKKNVIELSYNRSIKRPEFSRLNPFRFYSSPNYYSMGNPYLLPSINNSVGATYSYDDKLFIYLSYDRARNNFTNFAQQNNATRTYSDIQLNLSDTHAYTLDAYYSDRIFNLINLSLNASIEQKQEKSFLNNIEISQKILHPVFRIVNSINILKKQAVTTEINYWYSGRNIQGIYKLDPMSDLNIGIKKAFKDKKGFIGLTVTDAFYTHYYNLNVNVLEQLNGFKEKNDTRGVFLNITYNFGKTKQNKQVSSIIQSEKNRIK